MRFAAFAAVFIVCSAHAGPVTVRIGPRPVNSFSVRQALGACVDGEEKGAASLVYTPANLRTMLSAGFQPLTYRLRTELAIEAWHWNPAGTWSDVARRRGYWTSDAPDIDLAAGDGKVHSVTPGPRLPDVSFGYRLPRRGSTTDEANNDGYSRLDDGDRRTFWKSNPYLDRHFTGEDNSLHPQYVVIDFGSRVGVNAARLLWAQPYATWYRVEYWRGPEGVSYQTTGDWTVFPGGSVENGKGRDALLRLCTEPVKARFVRIVMVEGSGTGPASPDVRDRLGYALREIYFGEVRGRRFIDAIRHGRSANGQSHVWATSTDPWHRETDRDTRIEQPGFDLVVRSGLTHGLPMLVPVGVLYDTPENAAAMVRYLLARGIPIRGVELGEEPDGQMASPEDFGALYVQFADAIHAVAPKLLLGGPSFEEIQTDVWAWPERKTHGSWLKRFLDYLKQRGRLADLGFLSFEWYPFEDIGKPTAPQLASAPGRMRRAVQRLYDDGLPRSVPLVMSEYGYSAYAGRPEVDVEGALLNADIVGQFLTLGGRSAYLYGYDPNVLIREKGDTWGNITLFLSDEERRIRYRLPTYWAARLVTQAWAGPADAIWDVYPASTGTQLVAAYALRRAPTHENPHPTLPLWKRGRETAAWSLLLVNKDPRKARRVLLPEGLRGPADVWQYGRAQYRWHAAGPHGHPTRDLPPERWRLKAGQDAITLPPYSITVVRRTAGRR